MKGDKDAGYQFTALDVLADILRAPEAQPATIVHERHNLIYAYGPLIRFTEVLESIGFSRGPISIPAPHAHNYHSAFDEDETSLAAALDWRYSPLQAGDEQ